MIRLLTNGFSTGRRNNLCVQNVLQLRLSSVHIKTSTSLVVIRFAASQTCEDALVLCGALRASLGDPAWGRAGRANIGQGTRAVRSWIVAASAAVVTSRRSSESNAVAVEVHCPYLEATPVKEFCNSIKIYRHEQTASISCWNETDCALSSVTKRLSTLSLCPKILYILRMRGCSIWQQEQQHHQSRVDQQFFLHYSWLLPLLALSCVQCIHDCNNFKVDYETDSQSMMYVRDVNTKLLVFITKNLFASLSKGNWNWILGHSWNEWGYMIRIFSSKSKLDIRVHEKANLSILWSTQDPGGLIPYFQHPVLSLLACVVYPPEKSTPNKCHCWGGADRSRQPRWSVVRTGKPRDRDAENYINHIASKTLN